MAGNNKKRKSSAGESADMKSKAPSSKDRQQETGGSKPAVGSLPDAVQNHRSSEDLQSADVSKKNVSRDGSTEAAKPAATSAPLISGYSSDSE